MTTSEHDVPAAAGHLAGLPTTEGAREKSAKWGAAVKSFGALVGLGLTALMVAELGPRALADAMRPALVTLPACFACEAARVLLETFATRAALGPWAKRVPFARLYAMHFVTYAVGQVLPMPRPAAEATKAALLKPYGVPLSASVSSGATLQAATFVAVGTMSTVCALFVAPVAGVPLRAILLVNTALLLGLGVGMRALARSEAVTGAVAGRFPRFTLQIAAFREESLRGPLVPMVPSVLLAMGMALNVLELAIVGHAMGARGGIAGAFAAFGAQIVAATVAVFVPGQLGAREATFSLAAGAFGTTALLAVGISTFTHGVQLVSALFGFAVLLVLRAGKPPHDATTHPST